MLNRKSKFKSPSHKEVLINDPINFRIVCLIKDKDYSIARIARELNFSYNSTFDRIKKLEKAGIIEKSREKKERGKPNKLRIVDTESKIMIKVRQETMEYAKKTLQYLQKNMPLWKKEILEKLIDNNGEISQVRLITEIKNKFNVKDRQIVSLLDHLEKKGILESRIRITKLGRKEVNK